MKYTDETLHGVVYQHQDGGPTYRIIQVYNDKDGFSHTTCDIKTGRTVKSWLKLEVACHWIETGVWILQKKESPIINNYQIY